MNDREQKLKQKISEILQSGETLSRQSELILGRKGVLNGELRQIKDLPVKERRAYGQFLNDLREEITHQLTPNDEKERAFDLSAPASLTPNGSKHPVNQSIDRMVGIFSRFGFEVVMGPEIVTDEDNFGSLNFPDDHPARDTQDSFILQDLPGLLMRTQTSAMQVPTMKKRQPPMRVIVPGKTFRREADATHQPMFNQLEGFIIDEQVTFTDLKGLLKHFVDEYFGQEVTLRFRPHYFPFTEPSAEIDMRWGELNGQPRWLEILGCGNIHPEVLKNAGIDPKKYRGVAFGLGVERPFMLRHGVDDMRLLYGNDEQFLSQFSML